MKRFALALPILALTLCAACGSSSTGTGGDGGAGTLPPGENTLSCMIQLSGFEPQCQFYEATGSDAAQAIAQLRAGCVDQGGSMAKAIDACPTADGLGGCKTAVPVKGSTNVQIFVTNFEYKPTTDASTLGTHTTPEQVKSFCTSQGGGATYVPPS